MGRRYRKIAAGTSREPQGSTVVRPDPSERRKPIIGLVGGIGSGKSTVAGILESLGAAVIDSDRAVHAQYAEPEVVETLRRWWGDSVCHPDGSIDRRAVAKIVFSDPRELSRLESLLWPRIEQVRQAQMPALLADPKVKAIVLDAPKLFEAGLHRQCDAVIFVEADRAERLRRLAESRGWSPDDLARRESLQAPLDNKRANADYVIFNNTPLDQLRIAVERVFSQIVDS